MPKENALLLVTIVFVSVAGYSSNRQHSQKLGSDPVPGAAVKVQEQVWVTSELQTWVFGPDGKRRRSITLTNRPTRLGEGEWVIGLYGKKYTGRAGGHSEIWLESGEIKATNVDIGDQATKPRPQRKHDAALPGPQIPRSGSPKKAAASSPPPQQPPPAPSHPLEGTAGTTAQHELGDTIRVRDGLSLRVVPGGPKTTELLSRDAAAGSTAFLLDFEFEAGRPVENALLDLDYGRSAREASGILLSIGEDRIGPEDRPAANIHGVAVKDKEGKRHFVTWLHEGKAIIGILFVLSPDQLAQEKKLTIGFLLNADKSATYSFALDLPATRRSP